MTRVAATALMGLLAATAFASTAAAVATAGTGGSDSDAGYAPDGRSTEELSPKVRALLDVNAGSLSLDTGLASIPPPPPPVPGVDETPPPSSPPPPGSVTEPPAIPVPPPTLTPTLTPTPTSTPTPTPTPTPTSTLPPTPTATAETSPPPAVTPPPVTLNPPTDPPQEITPEPTTRTPPDTTMPQATPSTAPSASGEAPKPTQEPSPTPKGNIIFNIQIVDDTVKKYIRSDKGTSTPSVSPSDDASSTTSAVKERRDGGSGDGDISSTSSTTGMSTRGNNVIGGRTRDNPINAIAMSKDAMAFHDVVRYASCTVAGISVALLLFFHYVSLDPNVDWSKLSAGLLWAPNTWEFVVYLGYLQQMGSFSQLDLPRTPYILWDYTDAFSWSFFLIRNSGAASLSRRLEAVVLTGVVAFGDRIGVEENSLLFLCSLAFLFVFSTLFIVYVTIVLLAKRKAESKFDAIINYSVVDSSSAGVYGLRFVSLRFLGLCVLIWLFALYPLSLFSTFEISMQIDSKVVSMGSLVLAITVLGLVCFGVLSHTVHKLYRKNEGELADEKNLAVWGSLYAAYTYRRRLFFLVVALVQLGSGVLIGSMTTAGSATGLIVALLVMQAAYLVAVFFQAGFVSLSIGLFTFALGVVKIANYAIAFAFLDSTNASSGVRSRSATVFIVLNSVVLIAWFARHTIMFVLALNALSQREEKEPTKPRSYRDSDWMHRFSHQHQLHAFHEEDDDALLPEMVEFQTPVEGDARSAGATDAGGCSNVSSEHHHQKSDGQVSVRGSKVFVAVMESPMHETDLSLLSEHE